MDLIGGIQHMDNRLGGRKPEHGKGRPAQKHAHGEDSNEKADPMPADQSPAEFDNPLGRQVDTTA